MYFILRIENFWLSFLLSEHDSSLKNSVYEVDYLSDQKITNRFKFGDGRTCVNIMVEAVGNDLTVVFSGGTVPHIGAIAIGVPIQSRNDPTKHRASISVITIPPHREDLIVRPAAEKLIRNLIKTTVVIAGIHLDNPTSQELKQIMENCDQGIEYLIDLFIKK